ncbi:Eco57I restriction-modification methylase domain-containing protein [Paraburkholderia sp. J12]|uniref:type IIG restriction enzyme/methyltransferase n=1 Tax=Paraburkholderia sp. J12 TaxID=2805432 RepID=UPI002ABDA99A|nr:Eco57I restriction-modification methylase domain-containing protein [Paraburkholderia sp. J12]
MRARHATLDQRFYAELLHIAGLCETATGGKPAIARRAAHARAPGSLVENALACIEARDGKTAQENQQRERFETVLRLCIAWLSRLVFLKLLETRLLALHDDDPAYAFLRSSHIRSFGELDALCREVLMNEAPASRASFPLIPRFDGSVFIAKDLENAGVPLGALANSPPLPVFAQTALIEAREALNPVRYLLDFLEAYDFSPHVKRPGHAGKPKVDTATLGLIFEKFNGYREGAWFTPDGVATYLAGTAIESAAIRRFNGLKGWHCKSIDQLCQAIRDRDEAREIVDTLRVCDPAAGSGHLLVSALNARVALKSRLGLLTDAAGNPLAGYDFEIESDRLVVKRENGTSLDSALAEEERQSLDAVLFREKRAIVENGLFGVDINPDAVRMTRLQLWIELLEHAGYDANGQFAILPNLDINIQQGNAAIQRFGFQSPLHGTERGRVALTARYRAAVSQYRASAGTNRAQRAAAADRLTHARAALAANLPTDAPHESSATSSVYADANAFEWRIAFPDVLDDAGAFRGFDAIVANPPYIDSERMANEGMLPVREHLARRWPAAKGNWDLYVVFMELGLALLTPTGAMACLTPDKWLSKPFGDAFRARYLDKIEHIAALGRGVFDRARVDSIVTLYANEGIGFVSTARCEGDMLVPLAQARKSGLAAPWRLDALLSPHYAFVQKMERSHATLGSLLCCENACATSDAYRLGPLVEEANGRFDPRRQFRVVNTGTLGRFISRWNERPMTYLGKRYQAPVVDRVRFAAEFANAYGGKAQARKVIVKGLTRLDAALDLAGDTIPGKTTLILRAADDSLLKFAAAVLNCPLSAFYLRARYPSASYNGGIAFTKAMIDSVPVPQAPEVRSAVVGLVDDLLTHSRAGCAAEAAAAAREIDALLYRAFGLSTREVAQIAGDDCSQS